MRRLITILAALLLLGCQPKTNEPYNVLFIAIDDLNDWTGFLGGHPQAQTPNMDRLAEMGMVFEHSYCAASLCNPSRAALMTGVSPASSGVYQNNHFMRNSDVLAEIKTLPEYFSDHGYHTTARGKIYHHANGDWAHPETWDEFNKTSGNGMNKHPRRTDSILVNGMPYKNSYQRGLDWGPLENIDETQTSDWLNAQWAAQFLQQKHDKPFFIACGLFRPHLPWFAPQKYFDKFPLESIQRPPLKENDMDDIPEIGREFCEGFNPDKDWMRLSQYGLHEEAVQAYLASINYVDDCFGQIIDALENSPYKENTIVVLWGDHGWHLGEKRHYRKYVLWEEACRQPLIVRVPGLTKDGSRCKRTVNLLDLYPTLVDLCQLPKNHKNEGNSLVPLLKDPESKWKHPSVTTMGYRRHAVRDENFRFIHYPDGSMELYDHQNDPQEWTNLANDPKYAHEIERLKGFLPKVNHKEVR